MKHSPRVYVNGVAALRYARGAICRELLRGVYSTPGGNSALSDNLHTFTGSTNSFTGLVGWKLSEINCNKGNINDYNNSFIATYLHFSENFVTTDFDNYAYTTENV